MQRFNNKILTKQHPDIKNHRKFFGGFLFETKPSVHNSIVLIHPVFLTTRSPTGSLPHGVVLEADDLNPVSHARLMAWISSLAAV